jgi:hypothetical protein
MPKTFVLSDESLNRFGFRVLTSGIDLTQFIKNPLMLYMHIRVTEGKKEEILLPIGRWDNIRVEGTQLLADAVFDQNDEFAKKIESKVEGGFLKMASAALDPIEFSSKKEYMLPGQKKPTLIKSIMNEGSIVDIGGNDNALALRHEGKVVQLADIDSVIIKLSLTADDAQSQNLKKVQMKEIAVKLGMAEEATEDQILLAIDAINTKLAAAESQVKLVNDKQIITLVDNAISQKKFTAEKKDTYIALGKSIGVEQLTVVLGDMNPMVKLSGKINEGDQDIPEGKYKDFDALKEAGVDAVIKLKKEDLPEYVKLFKGKFGFEPDLSSKSLEV